MTIRMTASKKTDEKENFDNGFAVRNRYIGKSTKENRNSSIGYPQHRKRWRKVLTYRISLK